MKFADDYKRKAASTNTCKFLSGGCLVAKTLLVAVGSVADKDEVGKPETVVVT